VGGFPERWKEVETASMEKVCPPPKVEVAADPGDGRPGIPSESVGCKEGATARPTPHTGKGVVYFADVHWTKKNRERYRITFTTDGITFRHVDSFAEIPAEAGDMVFVDTIPLSHTDGVIELLRRGVEVYYLRRLTIQKWRRDELKLPKTAKGDIKTLMVIDRRWFRRVSEDFLVMRRMISAYRGMLRMHQRLLNIGKATETGFKSTIRSLEEELDVMAVRIADEAGRRYPAYNRLVDELEIIGNAKAMEALAELIVYLNPDKGFRKTSDYLGLYKPIRGRKKIYDGRLRQALQRLTASTKNIQPSQLTARMEKEILTKMWMIYRQEAQGRQAIPAQG
jgi:hypothetical protein